jgi:D-alanyl-D-alanine carboxypeptidase/D-alanyl-D-alanine-endopeptidase (penicillin-binding protein 4)
VLAVAVVVSGGCHHTASVVAPLPPAPPAHSAPSGLVTLQHDIDAILAAPPLEHGYWGVMVKSLDTHDTLYAVNARKLMMPGSNMKIVTLAAAASRLGWDYRYETKLLADGAIADGKLNGNLIVVGSGDPSLTDATAPAVFASWADTLKAQGVRIIAGNVIGDDRAFSDDPLGMGWSWDDLQDGYAAGVGALQFNEDMARVTIEPGRAVGQPAFVTIAPEAAGLPGRNRVTTGDAGSTASIEMRRKAGSAMLEVIGSVPLGAPVTVRTVSVDNPTRYFLRALNSALNGAGIDVRGAAVGIHDIASAPADDTLSSLIDHRSPPLSELAVRLMKASQNQYAETFLRTLGASDGTPTAGHGAATASLIVQGWGVPAEGLIQRDGSGLSRYDYVSPEALVTILTYVDGDATLRTPFEASLPVAGRDGTLSNRMKGTAAEGNARAKSGSMANVRALSGYVTAASGERLVFSILANNFETAPEVINAATDAIVVRLAQFTRLPQRH